MYGTIEREKVDDQVRLLEMIFGKSEGSGSGATAGAGRNRLPQGFTPIPAKNTRIIDLDSIGSQEDVDAIMKRGMTKG